jgi:hypothetical protein
LNTLKSVTLFNSKGRLLNILIPIFITLLLQRFVLQY